MRRQFITHPRFQASFTTSFILGVLIVFLLIGGSTLLALMMLSQDPLLTETQRLILRTSAKEFGTYLAYLAVLSFLILGWIGFYLSYKFVGPLYRLELWLQDRLDNKSTDPIQLRPGDELEPVAMVLSRLVLKKFSVRGGR
jgi:hypothetical protein